MKLQRKIKAKFGLAFLLLVSLVGSIPISHAGELGFLPRLSYVVPPSNGVSVPDTFLGNYWYAGIVFFEDSGGEFRAEGPCIKVGIGETGTKLNLSYFAGNALFSLEGGISYIKQASDATLFINGNKKGYALEGAVRFGIVSAITIIAKDASSFELGFGF